MTGLEIALLVVGIAFFAGSFFFTEKLSSSDLKAIERMSQKEINVLIDKHLRGASDRIDAEMDNKLTDALNRLDKEADKTMTEELYSISEHADTIRSSLDTSFDAVKKSHDEIMFMYNMLSDKQEKVTELEAEAQHIESVLRSMKQSVEDAIARLEAEHGIKTVPIVDEPSVGLQENAPEPVSLAAEEERSLKDAFEEQFAAEISEINGDGGNINEQILELHRQGFSDVEIAKSLGKGLGEIKLVLGLFDEE